MPHRKPDQWPVVIFKMHVDETLGDVALTRVSMELTCPEDCPWRRSETCYIDGTAHTKRIEKHVTAASVTAGLDGHAVMRAEARAIRAAARKQKAQRWRRRDGAPGDGPRALRLHVQGETYDTAGARILAAAAKHWPGPVWTFTHRWRSIPRIAFGQISVLASVHRLDDARVAQERGYVPAIVVPAFPRQHLPWLEGGIKWLPCPAETTSTGRSHVLTCTECRHCMRDGELRDRNVGVAFAAHGPQGRTLRRVLRVLQ